MHKIQPNPDKIKVGDSFWSAIAWYDNDENKCHLDIDEWVVRSIKRPNNKKKWWERSSGHVKPKKVYLIQKTKWTWIKDIGKGKPYRWAKLISRDYKESFELGKDLPFRIFTTKLQALKDKLRSAINNIDTDSKKLAETNLPEDWVKELEQEIFEETKLLSVIKSRITKVKNSK